MNMAVIIAALVLFLTASAAGAQNRDSFVLRGWVQDRTAAKNVVRYVSPDGQSFVSARVVAADRKHLGQEMDAIAYHDGERITYQRRGRSWIAVSGFNGNRIFYRKSNLACGGSVWHLVELVYPATDKTRMDATVAKIARGMTRFKNTCPKPNAPNQ